MGLRSILDIWLVSIMSRYHVETDAHMVPGLPFTTQHRDPVEAEHCGWK